MMNLEDVVSGPMSVVNDDGMSSHYYGNSLYYGINDDPNEFHAIQKFNKKQLQYSSNHSRDSNDADEKDDHKTTSLDDDKSTIQESAAIGGDVNIDHDSLVKKGHRRRHPTYFYSLLNVPASDETTSIEIQRNFKLLSKVYHPDKSNNSNNSSESTATNRVVFILIKQAADTLLDPVLRLAYDSFGMIGLQVVSKHENNKGTKSADKTGSAQDLYMSIYQCLVVDQNKEKAIDIIRTAVYNYKLQRQILDMRRYYNDHIRTNQPSTTLVVSSTASYDVPLQYDVNRNKLQRQIQKYNSSGSSNAKQPPLSATSILFLLRYSFLSSASSSSKKNSTNATQNEIVFGDMKIHTRLKSNGICTIEKTSSITYRPVQGTNIGTNVTLSVSDFAIQLLTLWRNISSVIMSQQQQDKDSNTTGSHLTSSTSSETARSGTEPNELRQQSIANILMKLCKFSIHTSRQLTNGTFSQLAMKGNIIDSNTWTGVFYSQRDLLLLPTTTTNEGTTAATIKNTPVPEVQAHCRIGMNVMNGNVSDCTIGIQSKQTKQSQQEQEHNNNPERNDDEEQTNTKAKKSMWMLLSKTIKFWNAQLNVLYGTLSMSTLMSTTDGRYQFSLTSSFFLLSSFQQAPTTKISLLRVCTWSSSSNKSVIVSQRNTNISTFSSRNNNNIITMLNNQHPSLIQWTATYGIQYETFHYKSISYTGMWTIRFNLSNTNDFSINIPILIVPVQMFLPSLSTPPWPITAIVSYVAMKPIVETTIKTFFLMKRPFWFLLFNNNNETVQGQNCYVDGNDDRTATQAPNLFDVNGSDNIHTSFQPYHGERPQFDKVIHVVAAKKRRLEEMKNGLVILNAYYWFVPADLGKVDHSYQTTTTKMNFDDGIMDPSATSTTTTTLVDIFQFWVRLSQLMIPFDNGTIGSSSRTSSHSWYWWCSMYGNSEKVQVKEKKQQRALTIRYKYQGKVYEVTFHNTSNKKDWYDSECATEDANDDDDNTTTFVQLPNVNAVELGSSKLVS